MHYYFDISRFCHHYYTSDDQLYFFIEGPSMRKLYSVSVSTSMTKLTTFADITH